MVVRASILSLLVLVTCPAFAQSGRTGVRVTSGGQRTSGGSVRTSGGRVRVSGGRARVSTGRARVSTGRRLGTLPRRSARSRSYSRRPRPARAVVPSRVVVSGRSRQPRRRPSTARRSRVVVQPTQRNRGVVVRQSHGNAPVRVTFSTTRRCEPQTTHRVTPLTTYTVTPETTAPPPVPEIPPLGRTRKRLALGPRLALALEVENLEEACRLALWAEGDRQREQALRNALFMQLPSPTALERVAEQLRTEPRWRGIQGRDTLLRVMSSGRE